MKITIVYDNTLYKHGGLSADWGFSALVEMSSGKRILFDTGTSGDTHLNNMAILGVEPASIDEVFISHAHFDHVGGLPSFLKKNNQVKLWLPPSFRGRVDAKERIFVPSPMKLGEGVYSTGELEGIEQSMVLETSMGLVVVVGCSHPRMETILGTASQFGELYGIVGGLHGTRPKSLGGLDLICATHCTQHKSAIQALYPDAYQEGGVGRVIEVQ
jgi:7,8-dihydropterin-6-yl-methyl-4-(beta-D-ribofuranosyl)aminobenzene 5'-phosphate synthase